MESKQFDNLVRRTYEGASRRGVVRVGLGALAASALATIGLGREMTEAKKKKKKTICNCTSSDAATCSTQKTKKKKANNILNSNPCAYGGACQAGVSGCPAPPVQCPATSDRPVTCGSGCCPSEFPNCCQDADEPNPVNQTFCAPPSDVCCPLSAGGGSCSPNFPKCCPVTTQNEFGLCAEATDVCCTTETGGGSCPATDPVCCLVDPTDLESGNCCPAGSTCCQSDADCGGAPGSCLATGCCAVAPREAGAERGGRVRQRGKERFRMAAS